MKYKLFRSPGDLDKAVRKHELVAVETGKSIDDVADALIRAVRDDLAEMPEYAHCETAASAPEAVQSNSWADTRSPRHPSNWADAEGATSGATERLKTTSVLTNEA